MKKLITLALTASCLVYPDTLVLKSGVQLNGTYLGGDARQMKFESQNQIAVYPLTDVDSVRFTSAAGTGSGLQTPANPPGMQLPANTPITVRLIDPVNSQTAQPNQKYRASVDASVLIDNKTAVTAYSPAVVKLVEQEAAGKMAGHTSLTLALTELTVNGKSYEVSTTDVVEASKGKGSGSAKLTGGAAAAGALLGAIAGGGRGAAIGAGSGAAVGAAASVLRPGQKVNLPSETRLTFRLATPLSLP